MAVQTANLGGSLEKSELATSGTSDGVEDNRGKRGQYAEVLHTIPLVRDMSMTRDRSSGARQLARGRQ